MSGTAAESKYRGVWKRKWGKYVSEIRLPKSRERIWLGSYDTAEKAARAFDAALFCLRGRAAKFNFPDDPPEIPGGEGLSPPEIQAAAQRYADGHGGPGQADDGEEDGFRARPGPDETMDRAFWEMVDVNGGQNGDFGLYSEPGGMYMDDPYYVARVCEGEDGEEGYDHGGLWNF